MAVISMKALLESGVHFGHRTHKWNPGMRQYIYTERNGIHIIDLQKTSKSLDTAYNLVRDIVAKGGTVMFIGTKRQAQETIQQEAMRSEMPFVTERWLGGMLTNWRTIKARISELERLEHLRDGGGFGRVTKKELLIVGREIDRLQMLLGGIRKMTRVPDAVFVVDVNREATGIHEANLLGIPVVAMVDTNCDPGSVDYVIPSNDDAIRAIKLIVGKIADACIEGKSIRKDDVADMPTDSRSAPAARAKYVDEPQLSDEDLLGEATLAKLGGQSAPAAAVEEVEVVTGETPAADEAPVADEAAPEA